MRAELPILRARPTRWHSLLLALVVASVLPWLWRSLVAAPQLHVDIGAWGDHVYLSGTNAIEASPVENYRWTTARAEFVVPNLGDQYRLLRLRAYAWRPDGQVPEVRIDVAGQPWGHFQPTPELRIYHVLLPREPASPLIHVGFATDAQAQPSDPRELGLALDWIEIRTLGGPGPPNLWQLGGQALLLALLALLLVALALPIGWALALAALCGAALVWANFVQPLWVSDALVPWLILVSGLLAATWWLAPRLHHATLPWLSPSQAHLAWALFVAALGVRLFGAVHPLFNTHDLDVHTRWLDIVRSGQLYLYSTPGEFRGQETFNPPAGYLALMPLALLLPTARLAVQVGVALLDALGCLALLGLARELGLSGRAALLAVGVYIALPINMVMLWWGFATNTIAQPVWLVLLWMLMRVIRHPTRPTLYTFAVLCAISMLTHVGALALVGATLGLALLFAWRCLPKAGRNAVLAGLALALLFVVPIYFLAVAEPVISQFRTAGAPTRDIGATLAKTWSQHAVKLRLATLGLIRGFAPLPLALLPLGLASLLMARTLRPALRRLLVAWLGVCVLFLCADLGLNLLVRYVYFAIPLVCLGLGALLARMWQYNGGRLVVLALELTIAWAGLAVWIGGVLLRIKPSVIALSH